MIIDEKNKTMKEKSNGSQKYDENEESNIKRRKKKMEIPSEHSLAVLKLDNS